jgi:uncharacterized membrane protein
MEFGPVQILVVGFGEDSFTGEILPELRRLREADVIRLLDLMFVTKDEDGRMSTLDTTDLSPDESAQFGALAGALVGFGALGEEGLEAGAESGADLGPRAAADEETWAVADVIPPGGSAAVALIEHRWAIPLRDAIVRAGGVALEDTWVHPADLVTAGAMLRSKASEARGR